MRNEYKNKIVGELPAVKTSRPKICIVETATFTKYQLSRIKTVFEHQIINQTNLIERAFKVMGDENRKELENSIVVIDKSRKRFKEILKVCDKLLGEK